MQSNESLRDELLAEVEAVAPILAEHAPLSEKLGRLDEPTVEALSKTRLLRFACPRELGGCEADPVTGMEIFEAVTRIDGSVGWTLGILALTSAIAGAFLPVTTAQRIFARGVPPMAGLLAPIGKAEPVDGGYRVTGRWAFGSGIHHADWVLTGAFVPGQPLPAGIRMVVLPRGQVAIHDNWQVAGLKASGSCDYSIENAFVPDEMTFAFMDAIRGNAVTGGAALRLGVPAFVIPFHMAIALGIARRALDEITEQASRRPAAAHRRRLLPTHTSSLHWERQSCSSHRRGRSRSRLCRASGRKHWRSGFRHRRCKRRRVPLPCTSLRWRSG